MSVSRFSTSITVAPPGGHYRFFRFFFANTMIAVHGAVDVGRDAQFLLFVLI